MTFRPGIGTITIIALLIRIVLASFLGGLATDEANGVMIAVSGTWADMLENLKQDGNAPVFYALVRYFDTKFGHSEFAVKVLAVIIATIQVPAIYGLFRLVLPRYICLQLAWIITFCPSMVRYGVLVRPYATVALISLASSMLCIKVLTRGTSRLWSIPYGISTALIVYTHYWGAFVAIGQAGLAVIGLIRKWFGRRELLNWLIGVGISLLIFAPQLPVLFYQLKHDLSPWDNVARPMGLIAFFLPGTMLDIGGRVSWVDQLSMVICNVLVIAALTSSARFLRKDDETDETEIIDYSDPSERQSSTSTGEQTAMAGASVAEGTVAEPAVAGTSAISEAPSSGEPSEEAKLSSLLTTSNATASGGDTESATEGDIAGAGEKDGDTESGTISNTTNDSAATTGNDTITGTESDASAKDDTTSGTADGTTTEKEISQTPPEASSLEFEPSFNTAKWKALVLCGLAGCFLVNFILPSMRFRYMQPFVPMILVLSLTGADMFFRNQPRLLRYTAMCILWIAICLPQLQFISTLPETGTPAIVDRIKENADPEKDLVVISWQVIAPAITFDLPTDVPSITYPDLKRSDYNYWPEMTERVRVSGKLPVLISKMQEALDKDGKIWLIERARDIKPADYSSDTPLAHASFEETCNKRMDQIHSWLKDHGQIANKIQYAPGRDFGIFLTEFKKPSVQVPVLTPEQAPAQPENANLSPANLMTPTTDR